MKHIEITDDNGSASPLLGDVDFSVLSGADQNEFKQRLKRHLPRLLELLSDVYKGNDALDVHLKSLFQTMVDAYAERPDYLKRKDQERLEKPLWYKSENMVGMACYVDLMAGDLKGMSDKIPYLQELGITYLHLMPLYKCPEGDSDGGYAVSDYRCVNPSLGTMEDLRSLARDLDQAGICLVLDFVFNHTSDEHRWAVAARDGDETFRNYYYIFNDRTLPDQYEKTLREIFPQVRRGSFTYLEDIDKWVWTTFNSFQWDLNYSNPEVFIAIVSEMLFLANVGSDALRLDALAFIWKDMGTVCENRPNAHKLIQAFNACLKIAAPATVFKSEAIVHPDDVNSYIDSDECQLSYNPLLMALIWNSLATRETQLINQSLAHRFAIQPDCAWVNYARCHDDIGWTFDDADAWAVQINGYDHRLFLNQFYTGRFDGSFATGQGFQFNPANGDCRVCGSLASLAGLEQAIKDNDLILMEMAIRRISLIHSIILSIGGVPLIYAGDELAMLNDYSYESDPHKKHDARWVNRPLITAEDSALAEKSGTIQNRINGEIKKLIRLRKENPVLGSGDTRIIKTNNPHLFCYLRFSRELGRILVVCNFSEQQQTVDLDTFDQLSTIRTLVDIMRDNNAIEFNDSMLSVDPYQSCWLKIEVA